MRKLCLLALLVVVGVTACTVAPPVSPLPTPTPFVSPLWLLPPAAPPALHRWPAGATTPEQLCYCACSCWAP